MRWMVGSTSVPSASSAVREPRGCGVVATTRPCGSREHDVIGDPPRACPVGAGSEVVQEILRVPEREGQLLGAARRRQPALGLPQRGQCAFDRGLGRIGQDLGARRPGGPPERHRAALIPHGQVVWRVFEGGGPRHFVVLRRVGGREQHASARTDHAQQFTEEFQGVFQVLEHLEGDRRVVAALPFEVFLTQAFPLDVQPAPLRGATAVVLKSTPWPTIPAAAPFSRTSRVRNRLR